MYSVMDYWYITTRSLCPIFWEMPTTNIFDKSELILCVYRGWGWSIENLSSQWWTCCVGCSGFFLHHWSTVTNKRLFTNRAHTDKTGLHPMVYYCKINNGLSKIMDTTINGITLYENALEKSFNRCMYVTVIFYRNKEIGLSSRHYKLTGILSEGQFIPIGIRNQWLL